MCNILYLKAGQMPLERTEFDNMCFNNWHSFGLVTNVDGMLDIKKEVPESGELDSQKIWDLLVKDRQYDRFLHVRHNTAGGTTMENCHPFDVFYQERSGKAPRNIQFMHNGTLYDFKSKIVENGFSKDDTSPDAPSDSKNFVDLVLTWVLSGTDFGNGRGDIESQYTKILLNKFWPATGNRGILIANDQKPLLLGAWKTMKAADGSDIISSNDDYFKDVIRGPEKARRDAKRLSSTTSSFSTNTANTSTALVSYEKFDLRRDKPHDIFGLKESLGKVLDDCNVWDRPTAVALGAATKEELAKIYDEGKTTCTTLMEWIFADYYSLYRENYEVEEKHTKASKLIAELKDELKSLREFAKNNGFFNKKAS